MAQLVKNVGFPSLEDALVMGLGDTFKSYVTGVTFVAINGNYMNLKNLYSVTRFRLVGVVDCYDFDKCYTPVTL